MKIYVAEVVRLRKSSQKPKSDDFGYKNFTASKSQATPNFQFLVELAESNSMAISLSLVMFLVFWGLMLGQYVARKEVRLCLVLVAIAEFFMAIRIGELTAAVAMFPLFLISFTTKCFSIRWSWFAVWTLLPLGFSLWINVPRMIEVTQLLNSYHAESLAARLLPRVNAAAQISDHAESTLRSLTKEELHSTDMSSSARVEMQLIEKATRFELDNSNVGIHRDRVLGQLARLHETSLKIFEETPGFGTSRVREMPIRKSFVALPELERIPFSTPSNSTSRRTGPWTYMEDWGFVSNEQQAAALSTQQRWHVLSVANFVNSPGYGYIYWNNNLNRGDLEHVWGNRPHGFRFLPAFSDWRVERLDLVSLLLHDPPVVYVSENLPMMGELNTAPIRPLSQFEIASLKRLLEGEPLIVAPDNDRLRMMGAIRSSTSCLQCHEVENGRMLGAFSYELVRTPSANLP